MTRDDNPELGGPYSRVTFSGNVICNTGTISLHLELRDRTPGREDNLLGTETCQVPGPNGTCVTFPSPGTRSASGVVDLYDADYDKGLKVEVVLKVNYLAPPGYTWKNGCSPITNLRKIECSEFPSGTQVNSRWGTRTFSTGVTAPKFDCRYGNLGVNDGHRRQGSYTDPYELVRFGARLQCTGGATIVSMTTRLDDLSPGGVPQGTLATGATLTGGTFHENFRDVQLPYRNFPRGQTAQAVVAYTVKAPPGQVWRAWLETGCDLEYNFHTRVRCEGGGTDTLRVEIRDAGTNTGVEQQRRFTDNEPFTVPLQVRVTPHLEWFAWSPRPDSPGWENGYVTSARRLDAADVERLSVEACDVTPVPPGDLEPNPSSGLSAWWVLEVKYHAPGCASQVGSVELIAHVERQLQANGVVRYHDRLN